MAETATPSMKELKLDLKDTLKTGGQADSVFGVAEGISLTAAKEKAEHGGNAEMLALDLEASKLKIEKSGAGGVVTELAAGCLAGIGKATENFSKLHEWRRDGRLKKAANERKHIEDIVAAKSKKAESSEQKKIMTARVKELNPDFQVNKGLVKDIGEKLSGIGDAFKEVYKGWEKHWFKVNSKDAQAYANRAESAAKTSDKLYKLAENLRTQRKEDKGEQKARTTAESKAINTEFTTEQLRAMLAAKALEKARENDYFMPAAGAMAEDVLDKGGDKSLSGAKAANEKFVNRATK